MKKTLFVIAMLLSMTITYPYADTKNIGDEYKLIYTILDLSGSPVSGQSPTLKIQKSSNGWYYDFSDGMFKSSDQVALTATLSEDTTAQYYAYTFAPSTSEATPEQYLFIINNNDTVYKDHQIVNVDYLNMNPSSGSISGITDLVVHISSVIGRVDVNTNGVKDYGIWNGIEQLIKQER